MFDCLLNGSMFKSSCMLYVVCLKSSNPLLSKRIIISIKIKYTHTHTHTKENILNTLTKMELLMIKATKKETQLFSTGVLLRSFVHKRIYICTHIHTHTYYLSGIIKNNNCCNFFPSSLSLRLFLCVSHKQTHS